jgi:hypothetical protein
MPMMNSYICSDHNILSQRLGYHFERQRIQYIVQELNFGFVCSAGEIVTESRDINIYCHWLEEYIESAIHCDRRDRREFDDC